MLRALLMLASCRDVGSSLVADVPWSAAVIESAMRTKAPRSDGSFVAHAEATRRLGAEARRRRLKMARVAELRTASLLNGE